MKAPLQQTQYPRFFKTNKYLLAFISKDKMYKIENIGSNTNEGITIDFYKTRKMVLSYWPANYFKCEITALEFEQFYMKLFTAYKYKILAGTF
jgi:hypothetical protein